MKNKKGTEKPIEIFVALFVILAVALVMLKLFQNQVTQQQSEIDEIKQSQAQSELFQTARTYCQDKCSQATSNDCAPANLASLCIAYGSDKLDGLEFLDLDENGENAYDDKFLAGVGMCEDAVPCHVIIDKCCSKTIDYTSCKGILDTYWSTLTSDANQKAAFFQQNVKPGECYDTLADDSSEKAFHWYTLGGYEDASEAP